MSTLFFMRRPPLGKLTSLQLQSVHSRDELCPRKGGFGERGLTSGCMILLVTRASIRRRCREFRSTFIMMILM